MNTTDEESPLPLGNTTLQGVLDALPHGSGIDCEWTFEVVHADFVIFRNSYHMMNEHGMYDGWCDFWIKVKRVRQRKGNYLKGPSAGMVQILAEKGDWDWQLYLDKDAGRRSIAYGLKDYLQDTIHYALEGLGLEPPQRLLVTVKEWEAQS